MAQRRKWPRAISGLRARVILTYLIVFVVSAAIMIGRTGTLFARMALDSAERDLGVQAYLMASALEHPLLGDGDHEARGFAAAELQTLAGRLNERGSGQLTIVDSAGNPVATSLTAPPRNQAGQPEVAAALSGQAAQDTRRDPSTGQPMIYAAAPIGREGHVIGAVQVGVPQSEALARIRSFWLSLGLTACLAALGAALAGWLLASQLAGPVRRLRDAATRLARGDLSTRVARQETGEVTEIVQLADAFNDMAGRIQETLNRQRDFVANASHELRTPLTNIKLRAEALGNGALDDPSVSHRFVGEIESEVDRLSRLANDLLDLSRQDAEAPPFRETVRPADLVQQVVDEMSLQADRQGVSLTAEVQPDLPPIVADPVSLHTVLLNLVDNALHYTLAGGRVTVRARCSDPDSDGPGRALGSASLGMPAALLISVSDTGAGIPAEDLPHVFERFYRVDKARSRRLAQHAGGASLPVGSGAGLGLAIVRGIVEEHGGTVQAESEPGQGTVFTVTLPLRPQESAGL